MWEITNNKGNKRLEFELTVFENGYFKALLDYRDQPLKHGSFSVISLTGRSQLFLLLTENAAKNDEQV